MSASIPVLQRPPQTWTVEEAAPILHRSEDAVRRMCRLGRLDAEKYGEGQHGYWLLFSLRPVRPGEDNQPEPAPTSLAARRGR
ncbi:MAG TPA: hypothetical protein VIR57_00095 [Chloroflexota bacterium]|jgi:hypothetical protein